MWYDHVCSFASGTLRVTVRHTGAPTAGQSYNITCTVILDGTTGFPVIEWLGPNYSLVLNSSIVTVENVVMVNDSAYDRTLVFSSLRTSHGGQYTCRAVLGQASAMASTEVSVQSVSMELILYICTLHFVICDFSLANVTVTNSSSAYAGTNFNLTEFIAILAIFCPCFSNSTHEILLHIHTLKHSHISHKTHNLIPRHSLI